MDFAEEFEAEYVDDDVAAAEVVIFADANIFVAEPYSSELETAVFVVYATAELLASANER